MPAQLQQQLGGLHPASCDARQLGPRRGCGRRQLHPARAHLATRGRAGHTECCSAPHECSEGAWCVLGDSKSYLVHLCKGLLLKTPGTSAQLQFVLSPKPNVPPTRTMGPHSHHPPHTPSHTHPHPRVPPTSNTSFSCSPTSSVTAAVAPPLPPVGRTLQK